MTRIVSRKLLLIVAVAALSAVTQSNMSAGQVLAVGNDGKTRVLWHGTDGRISLWVVNSALAIESFREFGPFVGYLPVAITVGTDLRTRVLWRGTDGRISFWILDTALNLASFKEFGPFFGYLPETFDIGNDGNTRVLWKRTDGLISLWVVDGALNVISFKEFGPFFGYETSEALSVGRKDLPAHFVGPGSAKSPR